MTKNKTKILIAIILVAIMTFSLFTVALLTTRKGGSFGEGELNAAGGNVNMGLEDSNGKVDTTTTTGVAIHNAGELQTFLKGTDPSGYLANDIDGFVWDKCGSYVEFGKDRVLDGNGWKVNMSMKQPTVEYEMLNGFVMLDWVGALNEKVENNWSNVLGASGAFLAVNQGTIKNINFVADLTPTTANRYTYEWVPSGYRAEINEKEERKKNTKPLSFGLVTGANFGDITNCTVDYKKNSKIKLQNLSEKSLEQHAKENLNNIEFGCVAGVNAGAISDVTVNNNGYVELMARSSNKDYMSGAKGGDAGSRAIFGGIVGRMQSDSKAAVNKVQYKQATLYNSIITGTGSVSISADQKGKGVAYRHAGAAVGGNSPYSGTIVNVENQKSYGIIDGIISSFTGNLKAGGESTSGDPQYYSHRALVDCGKISNAMFLDNYTGHIDNCKCDGREHIATRANGVICDFGEGNVKVGFDKNFPTAASFQFTITPKTQKADDENVIFAVTKDSRQVDQNNNLIKVASANIFNYDDPNFYSGYNGKDVLATGKKATLSVTENRSLDDYDNFLLRLEFGKRVKAVYETAQGFTPTFDDKLAKNIDTFAYDYTEKGIAKIVSWSDIGAVDTFLENTKYRQFKAKVRQENEDLAAAKDAQQGILYPGVYTDIYILSTLSARQAYVDPDSRTVAKLDLNPSSGAQITHELKITPANIVAKDTNENIITGGTGANANDVAVAKLQALTFKEYTFRFNVFTINPSTKDRISLDPIVNTPGVTAGANRAYDGIEYASNGYDWKRITTREELLDILRITESTGASGRTFFFRAVKDTLKENSSEILLTTPVTKESEQYVLKIDGDAPIITATVAGGTNPDFQQWEFRDSWKKANFSLKFTISDATTSGITATIQKSGEAAQALALLNNEVTKEFTDDGVYNIVATDVYNNISVAYTVNAKVDTKTPNLTLNVYTDDATNLTINGSTASNETILATGNKITNNRDIRLKSSLSGQPSGLTYEYQLNGAAEWIKFTEQEATNGLLCDRILKTGGYDNKGNVVASVFDAYSIRVTSGAGAVSNVIELTVQIGKKLIKIDPKTIIIPDGIYDKTGLDATDTMKTYSGEDSLPSALILALTNAFNKAAGRTSTNLIEVGGYYKVFTPGKDREIVITANDPLGVFAIDTTSMNLKGNITPAQIQVTVNDATREYGKTYCNFTYTVKGVIGTDIVDLSTMIKPRDGVNEFSEVSSTGYPITVPDIGTKIGNYTISAINTNATMLITPQILTSIEYNADYLGGFTYTGSGYNVVASYRQPNGTLSPLNVEYAKKNASGVYEAMAVGALPTDVADYRATFSITDNKNYQLEESRAILDFAVNLGEVNFAFNGLQPTGTSFVTKYSGKDFVLEPIASNGATAEQVTVTYLNSAGGGINGYPKDAGSYKIRVVYNNRKDLRPNMSGNFGDKVVLYSLTINKITYTEAGITPNALVKTYDNQPAQIILDNVPDDTTIPGGITLIPGSSPKRYLALEATDAGTYIKKFRLVNKNIVDQELSASITINKASFINNVGGVANAYIPNVTATYDGLGHTTGLEGLPAGVDVKVMREIGTSQGVTIDANNKVTMTEAGNYTIIMRLSNRNYVQTTVTGKLTINRLNMVGATITTGKAVYDGKAHGVVVNGIASDINMKSKTEVYAYIGSSSYKLTPANNEHTQWIVEGAVNAGRYDVIVNVENNNYNFVRLVSEILIEKAAYAKGNPLTDTKIDSKTIVYDGNQQSLVLSNIPAGTKVTTTVGTVITEQVFIEGGALTVPIEKNSGQYKMSALLENNNFINTTLTGSLIIDKAPYDMVVTFPGFTEDYVENVPKNITFDATGLYVGSVVAFNAIPGMEVSPDGKTLTFVNAGTYNVKMTITHPNYVDKVVDAQFIINKIAAPYAGNVVITDLTVPYDGTSKKLAITGTPEGDKELTITAMYEGMITSNVLPTNAGVYKVDVVISHTNYKDIVGKAVLTITKGIMNLEGSTIDSTTVDYDGATHSVVANDPNNIPFEGEYKPIFKYGDLPEGVAPINAGTYSVTARITRVNYEDFIIANAGELIINKVASPELKMKNITKKYNGKEQAIVIERADGEKLSGYTAVCEIGGKEYSSFTNAGTYECEVTVKQMNYLDVVVKGTIKIDPIKVDVTYTGVDDTYAGKDLALVGKYTGVDGATHDVTFTFPEGYDGTKAGKFIATATFPDGNYVASEATATVEFVVKTANVAAIAGGTAGGVVLIGASVGLFFILKKKRIKL